MKTVTRNPFQTLSNAGERDKLLVGGSRFTDDEPPFVKAMRLGKLPQGVKLANPKAPKAMTKLAAKADQKKQLAEVRDVARKHKKASFDAALKTKSAKKVNRKKSGLTGKIHFGTGKKVSFAMALKNTHRNRRKRG